VKLALIVGLNVLNITLQCEYCGDNIKNGPEQCDGNDLSGANCASVLGAGYTGTLSCTNTCTFNTNACTPMPKEVCDSTHPHLCLTQTQCISTNNYWYLNNCSNTCPQNTEDLNNDHLCTPKKPLEVTPQEKPFNFFSKIINFFKTLFN